MKNKKIKIGKLQMKAMLLAGVIMFESVFAGIGPVNAQTVSENETTTVVSEEVQAEGDSTETPKIRYSGTDGKVDWSIDANGKLTLTGDGDYVGEYSDDWYTSLPEWLEYAPDITSAVVTVSNMTSTSLMFWECKYLTSLDLSNFDTSNVTDMSGMFWECSSLTSIDLSNFNTSNVTNMASMFVECDSLKSVDFGNINTSNVTNMAGMFFGCSSLKNIDLSNFDTRNVTSMGWMFLLCRSLTGIDLSNFDMSNVQDMEGMLDGMDGLLKIELPNCPIEICLPGSFYVGENGLMQTVQPNSGKVTCILPVYADSYCGMNGHIYSSPIFTWAEDYSSATVYMECTREDCAYDIDDKHVQMDAVVTKETIQPTTEKEGATVYTATVKHKDKTYTDVKSVSISKLPQEPTNPQEPIEPQEPTSPQNPTSPQKPTSKPIGTSFKTSTTFYRVTKSGKTPEIAYMGPKNKKVKKVTIPATVKIDGVTYKVTSVATGALKKYKNLTNVTVGKNVTKIGKNAFYGCKKLKKIVIKSKKLKSVGKNAIKGIKKNATIDVPNSKKKAYKKLLKANTGYKKKTMKVK